MLLRDGPVANKFSKNSGGSGAGGLLGVYRQTESARSLPPPPLTTERAGVRFVKAGGIQQSRADVRTGSGTGPPRGKRCVRTGSWTGPPQGKKAPRFGIRSTVERD